MQTADIYQSEALGTTIVHAKAWQTLAEIATILGDKSYADTCNRRAQDLAEAVNRNLWLDDKGYYAMYLYGRDNLIVNPRAETLGEALSILWDVAPADRARTISESNPTTPFGTAIFYPQIADQPPYHNNALWPWVAAYWTLANAKVGNSDGVMQGIGSIFRPAALFTTNKENFVLDNGDIATVVNSSNMLWCLSGNIAVTMKILFGIHYETTGIRFAPFVPKTLAATRSLDGLHYRDATLDITVKGYGSKINRFLLNGKEHAPFIPESIKGHNYIEIIMADNEPTPLKVNTVPNLKAPLTPVTWISKETVSETPTTLDVLEWNPIEYIDHYIIVRDGKEIARTKSTTFHADEPGEYQVIGVNGDGTQSFASQPRSNVTEIRFEFPDETSIITSPEAQVKPQKPLQGYRGNGFVETDHLTKTLNIPVNVNNAGRYSISLRYANGNGPVNTQNKCAIRTLSVDGRRIGTLVFPQRGVGNWDDWGYTNTVETDLTPGIHSVTIDFLPENENMNFKVNHALIDQLILRPQTSAE